MSIKTKPYVPLFGEHNMNPTPEQTGCSAAGSNGLVCCCQRTCPADAATEDGAEMRIFACGIKSVEVKYYHRSSHYTGIDEVGGRHHLGERFPEPESPDTLDRFHNKRRLHQH